MSFFWGLGFCSKKMVCSCDSCVKCVPFMVVLLFLVFCCFRKEKEL